MLSVPVTLNINGKLVKGEVTLSRNATPEQVEEFKEIQRMTTLNKRAWYIFQMQFGIDDDGNYIDGAPRRGILI